MLNQLFWIVPICSVIALLFAWFFFKGMMKESEGNETDCRPCPQRGDGLSETAV